MAFYVIAFAEAFQPVLAIISTKYGLALDPRVISVPAALLLCAVIARKGADIGVGALWVVVGVLAVSLAMFFLGGPTEAALAGASPFATVERPDNFFVVFAIIFPAFTGMTAGVGLSGDLKNPRRSIPLGTVAATLAGMAVYVLIVIKMVYSATPAELAGDQFIMSRIAVWGPMHPHRSCRGDDFLCAGINTSRAANAPGAFIRPHSPCLRMESVPCQGARSQQ